jgi:hypothetical protein
MKKTLVLLALLSAVTVARAETVATQPNQAGGKIVLTDRACIHKDKNYDNLNRAYNYGSAGYTSEGCWGVEDETVIVYWIDTNQKMRYPVTAFTMNPNYSKSKSKNNRSM